jgi:hypothetical protein
MGVPKANKMIYWKCAARSSAAGRQMQPLVRLQLLRGTRCHCTALCAATTAIHFITRAAINARVLFVVHSSVGCTLPFRHFCTNSRTFFHALRVKKRIRCPKDKFRTGAAASSCLAFANIAESNPTMRIYNTARHESVTELSCQTNNAYAFQTLGTWLVVRFLDCLGAT